MNGGRKKQNIVLYAAAGNVAIASVLATLHEAFEYEKVVILAIRVSRV